VCVFPTNKHGDNRLLRRLWAFPSAMILQVIEYQHAETEFAVAAAESIETKQLDGTSNNSSSMEAVELKVLLGRVSAERDELREETARLRRITSTITTPLLGASTSAGGEGAGARGTVGATVLGASKRGSTKVAVTAAEAVSTAGSRVNGQKEKQQAATNILVMELNDQVLRSAFFNSFDLKSLNTSPF